MLCLTPGSLLHVSRNFNLLPTTGTQETVFQVGQPRTRLALTNVCSLPQLPELMATACCVAVVDKSVSRGFLLVWSLTLPQVAAHLGCDSYGFNTFDPGGQRLIDWLSLTQSLC